MKNFVFPDIVICECDYSDTICTSTDETQVNYNDVHGTDQPQKISRSRDSIWDD